MSELSMPPCPVCTRKVGNVKTEAVEAGWSADSLTRIPPRSWTYTLQPCGHEVDGYDGDSLGNVFRWHR